MATHYFGSHRGGIETVAEKLFIELAALEQEVVWIASDATAPPEPVERSRGLGIPAFNLVEKKLGVPFPVPTLRGVQRIHNEIRNTDLVIFHDCLYLISILTFLFAWIYAVPVIIVQHVGAGAYTHSMLSGLMRLGNAFVTRPMLKHADQVVFISETTKAHFKRVCFRKTPAVIFNGVDTSVFRQLRFGDRKADLRRAFALPPERPVILFVGRFVEWKGLPVLKHMVEMEQDYSWAFAGWGPIDPAQWNASNVYVFSKLYGELLAELYRASDVFVLPSLREGFPVVIQEALATGLPVVCGSETVTADPALKQFVYGVELIPENNRASAVAFNAMLRDVIRWETATVRLSEERRRFASSRYCWQQAAESYMGLASSLVPESKRWRSEIPQKKLAASYRNSQIEDHVAP